MSESLYEIARSKGSTREFASLMDQLRQRASEFARLQRQFADQILVNRAAREGRPAGFSKRQRQTIEEFEQDGAKADQQFRRLLEHTDRSEREWVELAIECERNDVDFDASMLTSFHADDQPTALRLLDMKKQNVEMLQRFLSSHPVRL